VKGFSNNEYVLDIKHRLASLKGF